MQIKWLSLCAVSLLAACQAPPAETRAAPVEVSQLVIKPHDIALQSEFTGETAGVRDVEVRARVAGILLKRTYAEGQPVRQGQVLFEIDPEPYKAALNQAKGELARQVAMFNKTRTDQERIAPLFKENAVSKKDYDDSISAFEAAKASVEAAQAQVRTAQLNLSYTQVTAPISGISSKEVQSEGSLINNNSPLPLTTISQMSPLYANFSVSEQDYQHFSPGKSLQATLRLANGATYPIQGTVNFHDNRIDNNTGTISMRAQFDNPKGDLLPGQFVRVLVDQGIRQQAITIPERAIVQLQAEKRVLLLNDKNIVESRKVTLGESIGHEVIVESGLKAGERIIVDGLVKARPGQAVSIKKEG
ncbi:efflux RND transporter periplasmic adaptor subunit [Iodobacter sp. LRB]|uniref:efflux RND transporter periplasmic adaptor subunit n=1 Tax=unclassified Iodobacter TaxID=235634 RepID=UPI000C0E7C4A|nr:efflux RND transporter periplasmic adaptor subunit [Iodobacter sp. BJB302]PHV00568.1 efflux transporter periplasmic adaptor subunit [Iodobacter sp. BJB302]